jgi:hypothetical protein
LETNQRQRAAVLGWRGREFLGRQCGAIAVVEALAKALQLGERAIVRAFGGIDVAQQAVW